jgi:hypothetical protein
MDFEAGWPGVPGGERQLRRLTLFLTTVAGRADLTSPSLKFVGLIQWRALVICLSTVPRKPVPGRGKQSQESDKLLIPGNL